MLRLKRISDTTNSASVFMGSVVQGFAIAGSDIQLNVGQDYTIELEHQLAVLRWPGYGES